MSETNATPASSSLKERWKALKKKLNELMETYGWVAIGVWFAIFGLTLGGFYIAIQRGLSVESGTGQTGALAVAYVATQGTKPLRIAATLVLTPVVAKLMGRPTGSQQR